VSQNHRIACDLVINNARVFDGSALREGRFSVGTDGNRISFVRTSAASASKEIDAAGRFLMPGLIDCHVHLLDMWKATDETTMAVDIQKELPSRLMDLLMAGVTTVKAVGDSEDDILHVRELLANGRLIGPRLFATGAAFAIAVGMVDPVVGAIERRERPCNHDPGVQIGGRSRRDASLNKTGERRLTRQARRIMLIAQVGADATPALRKEKRKLPYMRAHQEYVDVVGNCHAIEQHPADNHPLAIVPDLEISPTPAR
jgi:imidazolonepropionase-like amidohydrolase